MAGAGVLVSGGLALRLFAHPDTFFALRIGLGRLCPEQSRQHAFKLAQNIHDPNRPIVCESKLCQLEW